MENRNPLEVLGAGAFTENQSLRVEGPSVIYTKGRNQTIIPIGSIKRVMLYTPSLFRGNGSLVFVTSEGFGAGPLQLYFRDKGETEYAENIQKYIAEFQANSNTPTPSTVSCELDQIAKLKGLLDAGAITEEEFEAKKKQLLGL